MKKGIILIFCILGITFLTLHNSKGNITQENIADKILRFHVIANSDSVEDQELKMKVKNEVVEYMSVILQSSTSLKQSISIVNKHHDDILALSKNVIAAEGYDYDIKCQVCEMYFPIKTYGDITLPAGKYTAFRITIGEAKGHNWWCILYPPLCFVDASCGVVPDSSKKELQTILTAEEYQSIIDSPPENITFKFKYLTFLNKYIN